MRGILHVLSADDNAQLTNSTSFMQSPIDVLDPIENIVSSDVSILERQTMNCNSRFEKEQAMNGGDCLSITDLSSVKTSMHIFDEKVEYKKNSLMQPYYAESHTVDFESSPPPAFAHFVRIDDGLFFQHVNPTKSHLLQASYDLHENSAILHLPAFSTVLITWRNKSLMDRPIHLHGYKMELLDIYKPKREIHCSRASCELPVVYDSEDTLRELSSNNGNTVVKDTFILPAGGAVVTRIETLDPSISFANSLIVNIGKFDPFIWSNFW